jgi:hypothetical protein
MRILLNCGCKLVHYGEDDSWGVEWCNLHASAANLLEALEDIFALMDENKLVRNTSSDHLDSFATESVKFVMRLSKAQKAIEAANAP